MKVCPVQRYGLAAADVGLLSHATTVVAPTLPAARDLVQVAHKDPQWSWLCAEPR